ncbi:sigma-70 family RNA polymerase sigma factor [Eubacterium sp. 1001713B170207_170306_E7]|uniref:RNA polymerase sigma factor n=1 Tax=Eubacterium sp. 1001713B170207_170306_E7 TaxID=2787097 RepID=UPI00189C241A|nr:sigma-70 family RNA polymerase sigma factor [Eubacterium sp. 1001713B170207_170306_E7]
MEYNEIDTLAIKAQQGDSCAAALLERCFRPLMLSAASYGKTENYSFEDSLQDARLAFLEGIQAYDQAAGAGFAAFIKPYVYQKGQNRRRKCLRRLVRDVPAETRVGDEDGETLIDRLADPAAEIEAGYVRREEHARLAKALEELTPEERALLKAVYGQNQSIRRVSQHMGVGYSTLQYRHSRILKKLKRQL